jgi:hypothetical protein
VELARETGTRVVSFLRCLINVATGNLIDFSVYSSDTQTRARFGFAMRTHMSST